MWSRGTASPVAPAGLAAALLLAGPMAAPAADAPSDRGPEGYYRAPALSGDALLFTAEGDIWRVDPGGGAARRLTSHAGEETDAAVSPDGSTVAFTASYEGAPEVYTMPVEGGRPVRRTWHGRRASVVGWTPGGEILYATGARSTLPGSHLVRLDPATGRSRTVPLAQASEGVHDASGRTLFFTRHPFHGSHTKRYRGGTAQSIWRFADGDPEATPLTADFDGTSRWPMWREGRVYFASDRDGTMNLWSMTEDGADLRQHTFHAGWDVKQPCLSEGRIAYQLGADLRILDLVAGEDRRVPITLASDFEQTRETWIDKPMDYLTAAHLSPDGDRIVLTARGEVFVAPARNGRFVQATRAPGIRYRDARFLPGGRSLVVLSDESGEVEHWRLPADGVGPRERLSAGAKSLRFGGPPSPDGVWVAFQDKNRDLRLLRLADREERVVARSLTGGFTGLAWSPDSRHLAFVQNAENGFAQVWIHDLREGVSFPATTDRFDSTDPAWSPDGNWLYFLSDRRLKSLTRSVWGSRQPEPYLDSSTSIFLLALTEGLRSPFLAPDELHPEEADEEGDGRDGGVARGGEPGGRGEGGPRAGGDGGGVERTPGGGNGGDPPNRGGVDGGAERGRGGKERGAVVVRIDRDALRERLTEVPLDPGNYRDLAVGAKHLYFLSSSPGDPSKAALRTLEIDWDHGGPKTLAEEVREFELSADGERILMRKGDDLLVIDATSDGPADLSKAKVDLSAWTFPLDPREERRQMFIEAWRLERDYFYDPGMHGVDWDGVLRKYLPLVDRITDRAELSDLLGEMVGELSVLHSWVYGGDFREGPDPVHPAFLGALLERDEPAGGYRILEIHRTDPDRPWELSPLLRPGAELREGDVVASINGIDLVEVSDPGAPLRHQAGRPVRLRVFPGGDERKMRDVLVEPLDPAGERELRYDAWEYQRRLRVEEWGEGRLGYVHLRAMGAADYEDWAREFYPVWRREGLVIDLRNNNGGNIDSWILSRLLRRAWMWWQPRVGRPEPNMQFAFTGHLAVIVNEHTISDGEAFAEGFRRLGLGPVVGTRSWGGEVWLTSSNLLVDGGIAAAAEFGVYGPEGAWLIEGHGVDPDIEVDNLPHATFLGEDAQLRAAVDHLLGELETNPVAVPPPPPYPDKAGPAPGPRPVESERERSPREPGSRPER